MSGRSPFQTASYPVFVLISVSYVLLIVLLLLFIVAPSWSSRTQTLGQLEIACALPSIVMALFTNIWFGDQMIRDMNGQVRRAKLQTAALVLYAGAELGVLLGMFVSNSQYGVVLGLVFFPLSFLIGFRRATLLWKSAE